MLSALPVGGGGGFRLVGARDLAAHGARGVVEEGEDLLDGHVEVGVVVDDIGQDLEGRAAHRGLRFLQFLDQLGEAEIRQRAGAAEAQNDGRRHFLITGSCTLPEMLSVARSVWVGVFTSATTRPAKPPPASMSRLAPAFIAPAVTAMLRNCTVPLS